VMAGHPIMESHMNLNSRHQLRLPFEPELLNDATLRAAYARTHLNVTFEAALRDKALAICLRSLARAQMRKRNRHR
jgi:hypothetical protein